MFTADAFIDTVQTGKKTWVNTFVTNDTMKDAMVKFIDNQAEYTKKAVKATTDAATTVASETVKAVQEASKFDYSKFGEGIMKAYTAQTAKTK
jgi:SHS2 domain-containing protein